MAVVRHRGLRDTIELSAMIFAIIIGWLIFARFLALSGVTAQIGGFLTDGSLCHAGLSGARNVSRPSSAAGDFSVNHSPSDDAARI
jgi:hypothetical protein